MPERGRMVGNNETRADILIQGVGLGASLVGVGVMIYLAWSSASSNGAATLAAAIYGLTLIVMFTFSLLNSAVHGPRIRPIIQTLDHSAIYLLIAGTYTPFCLMGIGGTAGRNLLVGVWLGALIGVGLRVWFHGRLKGAVITLYILLGWSGLLHLDDIIRCLPVSGMILLAVGGLLYSLGAPIHRLSRLRYHSAIWHGFVLGAASCHYAAILLIMSGSQKMA